MTNLFTTLCNLPKLSKESLRFLLQRPRRLIHPVQGHFFLSFYWPAACTGQPPGQRGTRDFFYKNRRGAQDPYLLQTSLLFHYWEQSFQRLVISEALLSTETYDELRWTWQENKHKLYRLPTLMISQRSEHAVPRRAFTCTKIVHRKDLRWDHRKLNFNNPQGHCCWKECK